ncbi:MAG: hypothetical protein ABIQ88_20610 [Chitinophagaceae bacterium]
MPADDEVKIEQYLNQVEKKTTERKPYDRLMIHYRKEKKLTQEMAVINKAIAVFSKTKADKPSTAAVKRLSKSIGQATGLIDKAGKHTYMPGPLQQWMRRKEIVAGKIAARQKKKK